MHIITRKRLLEFSRKHPDCSAALESWYRITKRSDFNSFAELRQTFPSADNVGNLTVFNMVKIKLKKKITDSPLLLNATLSMGSLITENQITRQFFAKNRKGKDPIIFKIDGTVAEPYITRSNN